MTNDGFNSFSQARAHPATESEVAEEAIRQKRGAALSQSEREQLILTCINALSDEVRKLGIRLDTHTQNLATIQRMIQSYAAGTNQHVTNMEMDIARHVSMKVDEAFNSVMAKQRPQPKRRKGKR